MLKRTIFLRLDFDIRKKRSIFALAIGGLAQLARALAWHARGHRFDPDILHEATIERLSLFFVPILFGPMTDKPPLSREVWRVDQ